MQKLTLKNRKDQTIVGELDIPKEKAKGVCIIQHGYGGTKQEPHIQRLKDAWYDSGFNTLTFDATNSFGESDGEYEKAALGLHSEDLVDVIEWAKQQDWFGGIFALTGHSMGGYAVLKYAEDHPGDIDMIVSLAPVVSGKLSWEAHERYHPEELQGWKESGWLVKERKSRPGTFRRSPWSHMEERLNHDLIPKAEHLTMPILLYVGDQDTSCPPDHIKILYDAIPEGNKKMVVAQGVGHVYRTDEEKEHLYQTVINWLHYESKS